VKASSHELKGLEAERQVAVSWIKKERGCLKLQTYRFFVDLGDIIKQYNEAMSKISTKREDVRIKKEERKEMYVKNSALVQEITNLHHQQEEADRRQKELRKDFELLERQDIMINNEKKHKISEIAKQEKNIKDMEKEK